MPGSLDVPITLTTAQADAVAQLAVACAMVISPATLQRLAPGPLGRLIGSAAYTALPHTRTHDFWLDLARLVSDAAHRSRAGTPPPGQSTRPPSRRRKGR